MKCNLKLLQGPEENGKNLSEMGDAKEIWHDTVFFVSLLGKAIRGNW